VKTPEKPLNDEEAGQEDSPCTVFRGTERSLALQEDAWPTACLGIPAASELKGLKEDLNHPAPLLGDVAKELFGTAGEDAKLPAKQKKKKQTNEMKPTNKTTKQMKDPPTSSKQLAMPQAMKASPKEQSTEETKQEDQTDLPTKTNGPQTQPVKDTIPPGPGIDAMFPSSEGDCQLADPPSDVDDRRRTWR
jgi:hypothetical protein